MICLPLGQIQTGRTLEACLLATAFNAASTLIKLLCFAPLPLPLAFGWSQVDSKPRSCSGTCKYQRRIHRILTCCSHRSLIVIAVINKFLCKVGMEGLLSLCSPCGPLVYHPSISNDNSQDRNTNPDMPRVTFQFSFQLKCVLAMAVVLVNPCTG